MLVNIMNYKKGIEMNYLELKESMRDFNTVYKNRFRLNGDVLYIGTLNRPFTFSEGDYGDAEAFINKFGMFKRNEDCLGDELYYKGLKWNELTKEQQQSVIDSYKDDVHFIKDPLRYNSLFNDNRCFLEYIF